MSPAAPVLVTGATGLVGSAVVRELQHSGQRVIGVSRRASGEARIDLVSREAESDLAKLGEIGGVIHCAAVFPAVDSGDGAEACRLANATMDAHVARLAQERLCRVVMCSSASVYGPHSTDDEVEEFGPTSPEGPYARGKLESELLFTGLGSGSVSLRITSPYGLDMTKRTVLTIFAEQARAGGPVIYFGNGTRTQDFVHVADVARACVSALGSESASGPFNIGSGRPIGMRELAELFVEEAGLGGFARASGTPDPQEHQRANYSIRRAAEVLGWVPTIDLLTGLRSLVRSS
ncbi:NAD-dependent epimerase/dehydratase family protein [Nocardioides marmorisolisilvae]|uniref:NAD-dependent epimerase/dehydratase family protein n=1 Tax=Nocardioides marmorisolisilvae TaxID=1542737 RepID=UPI00160A8026|nr:NAD(P)-dependent oxidoreductase [Nocardioides marmorisolisilvae]